MCGLSQPKIDPGLLTAAPVQVWNGEAPGFHEQLSALCLLVNTTELLGLPTCYLEKVTFKVKGEFIIIFYFPSFDNDLYQPAMMRWWSDGCLGNDLTVLLCFLFQISWTNLEPVWSIWLLFSDVTVVITDRNDGQNYKNKTQIVKIKLILLLAGLT